MNEDNPSSPPGMPDAPLPDKPDSSASEPEKPFQFDPYTGAPVIAQEAKPPDAPTTPGKRPSQKTVFLIGGAAVALIVIVVVAILLSGGHGLSQAKQHTLTISLDLVRPQISGIYSKNSCIVSDTGYSDLSEGAPVTVKDASGMILASTFLPAGSTGSGFCHWEIQVTVQDSSFYQIEVSHRGAVTFTKADLASKAWKASLSIGG